MKAENVNIVPCNLRSTVLDGSTVTDGNVFLCLNCLAMIRDIAHSFKRFFVQIDFNAFVIRNVYAGHGK